MKRKEYEITQEQLDALVKASQSVPYMVFGGVEPSSPEQNANRAWERLGAELGFEYLSVRAVAGKSQRFFTAVEA